MSSACVMRTDRSSIGVLGSFRSSGRMSRWCTAYVLPMPQPASMASVCDCTSCRRHRSPSTHTSFGYAFPSSPTCISRVRIVQSNLLPNTSLTLSASDTTACHTLVETATPSLRTQRVPSPSLSSCSRCLSIPRVRCGASPDVEHGGGRIGTALWNGSCPTLEPTPYENVARCCALSHATPRTHARTHRYK